MDHGPVFDSDRRNSGVSYETASRSIRCQQLKQDRPVAFAGLEYLNVRVREPALDDPGGLGHFERIRAKCRAGRDADECVYAENGNTDLLGS